MRVVISQSMYFPWAGLLEQIRLADVFVHYDDVQFARGFMNRVQIKTTKGSQWITVPTRKHPRETTIDHVCVDDSLDWRARHRNLLLNNYHGARYMQDMLTLFDWTVGAPASLLVEVTRRSIRALVSYFGIGNGCEFLCSSSIPTAGRSTQRLLGICKYLNADTYITGLGALNYLDHEMFERNQIEVRYMSYEKAAYPQLHGPFCPYVSGLDLVANCGTSVVHAIRSTSVPWRQIVYGSK